MKRRTSPKAQAVRLVGVSAAATLLLATMSAGTATAAVDPGALECFVPAGAATSHGVVAKDPITSRADVAAAEREFQQMLATKGIDLDSLDSADPVDIELYVHVLRKNNSVRGGNIPDQWIADLVVYLNDSFHGTGHSIGGAVTPFTFERPRAGRDLSLRPHDEEAVVQQRRELGPPRRRAGHEDCTSRARKHCRDAQPLHRERCPERLVRHRDLPVDV